MISKLNFDLSYKFLGQSIKSKSYFSKLSMIILNIKYWIKKSGIIVRNEEKIFKNFTQSNNFQFYIDEIHNDKILSNHWETEMKKRKKNKYKNWSHFMSIKHSNILLFYALIRKLKPKIVVETGTAAGSTTSFILSALNKNNKGKLISIDLAPKKNKMTMDITLKKSDVGYLIPKTYKKNWTYIDGDAKIKLLEICSRYKVDFFIHDSLHTPSHMMLEYSIARRFMLENTIISSDDILWNNVFESFLDSQNLVGYAPISNPNQAIFLNKFDNFEKRNFT